MKKNDVRQVNADDEFLRGFNSGYEEEASTPTYSPQRTTNQPPERLPGNSGIGAQTPERDTIFMDELSTYALTVQGYMSQGRTEADARQLAGEDILKRLGESALSGALMGVLFGGGASASAYHRSQLAARGEAMLRAQEVPTIREIEPAIMPIFDMPVGTELTLVYEGQRKFFVDSNTGKPVRSE